MNAKNILLSAGTVAVMAAGSALAAGNTVVSRSLDDAQADLMRTYTSPGGPTVAVKSRSADECFADLMRDFDGKLTKSQGAIVGVASTAPTVGSRSTDDAYKDMMRIW